MNSVQENKNELEAAVRYCESAISRAKQTIESMEFRQQAASKSWREQTGREAALEREVADLKLKNEELKTNMALLTDENLKLRETNNLQKDQIAMFQRKMSRLNEVNR
jgi:chromosome segregation ATPase